MSTGNDAWTSAHDLALVYIALAYGTDHELTDAELESITARLLDWRPGFDLNEAQEVVLEAMSVYLEAAPGEVARSIQALRGNLTEEQRQRALQDIVGIAEADGIMLTSERGLISVLASAWGLKATGDRLLNASTAPVEHRQAWSLMHDIGLMYVVLAHSTDEDLADDEIAAMVERLGDWEPELEEEQVRRVLREALEVYAQEPDASVYRDAVGAIQNGLSMIQRLALLDDLVFIAEVDGVLNPREKEMIATLAKAWHIGVHLNGQTVPLRPD